ncbi:MAG: TMEM175 family protein [Actinomycetota bacterium]|nr:TMEM175 family protein [Actinomycetota bacterium]
MSTNRLESFSDGVLAVAITLLVLNITVPPTPGDLGHELGTNWPAYAAYVTSFLTIGIIWINHHVMIGRLRETDYAILILNLLLLMTVAVIPFATSLLATYLRERHGNHLAAAVYGGVLVSMAITFTLLNHQILFRKHHLLTSELPLERRRQIFARSFTGLIPYVVATALAPVSAYLTLGISAAMAAFYALPIASGLDQPE